ncbi:MAG: glycosyltransferase [Saprospiraceae bacterium]|nr:glycosyltransferase [Saprospiraceae bacterium]
MKYSVIVPVFDRPQEVEELLNSLAAQVSMDFELVIVEDGSTERCDDVLASFSDILQIRYFFKENSGPGDSRNFGMEKARGEYLIFFDSDCLIPADYFQKLDTFLDAHPEVDVFGGSDGQHQSFSKIQKAINYAMTSFITTGGIRGNKKHIGKFEPRSFNMGFTKEVYKKVGGFATVHPGEDPDLSIRIVKAGFTSSLVPDLYVYHKRRIDWSKFAKQVYKFGVVRNILIRWHPGTFKYVFALPSIFLWSSVGLILLAILVSWWFMVPLVVLAFVIWIDAWMKTKDLSISLLACAASFIQLWGYGWGFTRSFVALHILKRNERQAFPAFFFD